jgi:hypothetical protein
MTNGDVNAIAAEIKPILEQKIKITPVSDIPDNG